MKPMDQIKGSFAVAFTPFFKDGRVDYQQFEEEIDYLSNTGAGGVVMYGMTSEYHKLTDIEKSKLTNIMLRSLRGRNCLAVLSVTDWSTEAAVARATEYEALGADALMLMPPFYYSPHIDEIRHHITSVLEAVRIPVLIQYAPLATKMFLPEEELVAMSDRYPHAAFKIEYRPAVAFMSKFFALKPDMPIMTGWAGLDIIDLYKIGVRGVITVGGFTELYVEIFRALDAGDEARAQEVYDKLEKYIAGWMMSPESLLGIEKELLHRRGLLRSSCCRRPCYHLTDENHLEIDRFLEEFAAYFA